MNIHFNKTKLEYQLEVEQKDLPDVARLEALMASEDWQIFLSAYGNLREMMLEAIENIVASDQDIHRAQLKAAVFRGFNMPLRLVGDIVAYGKALREDLQKQNEDILEGDEQ